MIFLKHNSDIPNAEMRKWNELREECTLESRVKDDYLCKAMGVFKKKASQERRKPAAFHLGNSCRKHANKTLYIQVKASKKRRTKA